MGWNIGMDEQTWMSRAHGEDGIWQEQWIRQRPSSEVSDGKYVPRVQHTAAGLSPLQHGMGAPLQGHQGRGAASGLGCLPFGPELRQPNLYEGHRGDLTLFKC